jgi:peptidoglycan-associated lipoprotein
MKHSTLVLALLAAVALAGCGKTPPPPPPAPPPAPTPPPPAPTPEPTPIPQPSEYDRIKAMSIDDIERLKLLEEIHFDFDKSDIREADRAILEKNAATLKKFDYLKVTIEGHCDERGTVEYNLALGERRAAAAHEYLISLGVPAERLKTVSYGKEVPLCRESTEECWARNRRDHFTVTGKTE